MSRWPTKQLLRWLLIALVWCLLGWALYQVGLRAIWAVLSRLTAIQLGLWALLNLGVLLTFAFRLGVLLRPFACQLPLVQRLRYRLMAFGVTYFTPGPQVGGEALLIYLLTRRHQLATPAALATITMDRLIDLFVNFGFLLAGFFLIVQQGWLPATLGYQGVASTLVVVILPLWLVVALWQGEQPVSALLHRLATWLARQQWLPNLLHRAHQTIARTEVQAHLLLRNHPAAVSQALLLALGSWLLMIVEFRYALYALGFELSFAQSIAAMVGARVAYLLPIPGGVGVLESSLALTLTLLGLQPADGVALSLLIRGRDLALAALGLWLGQRTLRDRAQFEVAEHSRLVA